MLRVFFSFCVCFLFVLSVMPFTTGCAKDARGLQHDADVGKIDLGRIDATVFLPKPPDSASLLFQYDKDCYEKGKVLRQNPETARQAAEAADTHNLPEYFSEAFGATISKDTLPTLYKLIMRVRKTFGNSAKSLKTVYGRERPFMLYGDSTCFREGRTTPKTKGSYPSAHSTRGWGVALLLSEINPERAEAILKRGMDFGQYRVICGYHWQTDVDAGRLLAGALFARLHDNPEFQAELEKAKVEFAGLHNRPEGEKGKEGTHTKKHTKK